GHTGALQLTYRFDAGWKFVRLITGRADFNTIEGKPSSLGLWVYGDGAGNSPRMRFTDSTGQTFQPAAPDITWKGWRYISFPLDGKEGGSWGGAKDGVIHYPIHLDTLFLLDGNHKATHGQIYLSGPTWIW
nr:hypothetical protein [Armatimonadota bacterium]